MRHREQLHRRLNQTLPVGFSLIPAGTFLMGSMDELRTGFETIFGMPTKMLMPTDPDAWPDEKPAHLVTLKPPFLMKQTEVTQAEWKRVMGNNPSYFKGEQYLPVETVSWFDAVAYCNILSEREGIEPAYSFFRAEGVPGKQDFYIQKVEWNKTSFGYRLPTEAEWEYACRGGTKTSRYGKLNDIAWYDVNSGKRTHPVGEKQPNRFGLYDMIGNVWEWCWDWSGKYTTGEQTNPTGPDTGMSRIERGGGWGNNAGACRASNRSSFVPVNRSRLLGFRVCRYLLPSEISQFYDWQKETEEAMFENPLQLRRLPNRRRR